MAKKLYKNFSSGDVFSVNWMEDSDRENLQKERLHDQFLIVQQETNTSHVMQYGELSMDSLTLSEFMGDEPTECCTTWPVSKADAVPQSEVHMKILQFRAKRAATLEEREYWLNQIDITKKVIFMTHAVGF